MSNNSVFFDIPVSAAFGYVASMGINAIHGSRVVNPTVTAIAFAISAVTTRIIYPVIRHVIPNETIAYFVYAGINLLAVAKIMKVAGIITQVPPILMTAGMYCGAITAVFIAVNVVLAAGRSPRYS